MLHSKPFNTKFGLDGAFYQDSNSQFKPLINGVIQTVAKPDDKIVVSVFNQSNALAKSPKIIYQGAGAKPMLADLQAQQIAYKNDKSLCRYRFY